MKTILNIGDRRGFPDEDAGRTLYTDEVLAAVLAQGHSIVRYEHKCGCLGGEGTHALELGAPLSSEAAHRLCVALGQDCIAQGAYEGDVFVGSLTGPRAYKWQPFNPMYFVVPSEEVADDHA